MSKNVIRWTAVVVLVVAAGVAVLLAWPSPSRPLASSPTCHALADIATYDAAHTTQTYPVLAANLLYANRALAAVTAPPASIATALNQATNTSATMYHIVGRIIAKATFTKGEQTAALLQIHLWRVSQTSLATWRRANC